MRPERERTGPWNGPVLEISAAGKRHDRGDSTRRVCRHADGSVDDRTPAELAEEARHRVREQYDVADLWRAWTRRQREHGTGQDRIAPRLEGNQ